MQIPCKKKLKKIRVKKLIPQRDFSHTVVCRDIS